MEPITKIGKRNILEIQGFGENPEGPNLISLGIVTSRLPKDRDITIQLGRIQLGRQLSTVPDDEGNFQDITVIGFMITRKIKDKEIKQKRAQEEMPGIEPGSESGQ